MLLRLLNEVKEVPNSIGSADYWVYLPAVYHFYNMKNMKVVDWEENRRVCGSLSLGNASALCFVQMRIFEVNVC